MSWKIINPKDISMILCEETMAPIFIYKGIRIKVSRTFIEDCRAHGIGESGIEQHILDEYNKNKIVVRDTKIDDIIKWI
jgi:hypothetical protein